MKVRDYGEAGFTLVEAIAAVGVTAITGAALMAALGSADARSNLADVRELALRRAQYLLAQSIHGEDPLSARRSGEIDGGRLTWSVTFGPANDPYPGLQDVHVEVNWRSGAKQGVTRLEAYRLAPP